MKIGDLVTPKGHKDRPQGKVINVYYINDELIYEVQYYDYFIPTIMKYKEEDLELIKSVSLPKCICGVDATRDGGIHSSWCNKKGIS